MTARVGAGRGETKDVNDGGVTAIVYEERGGTNGGAMMDEGVDPKMEMKIMGRDNQWN